MAQKLYKLEKCTNKEVLVRKHNFWLNQIRHLVTDTPSEQILRESWTNRPKCKIGDLQLSNRVNISELKLSVNKTLKGKYFLCRNITSPYGPTDIETVVEDPEGDNAVRLVLRDYLGLDYWARLDDERNLTHAVPIGALLVILNPFFTGAEPTTYTLFVDNPEYVLFIEQQDFQSIFPDLTWKGSMPIAEAAPWQQYQKINGEFNKADIIQHKCDAFVKILSDECKGKICDRCFEEGKLLRCSRCQLMFYCKKACQLRDWKDGHSIECKSDFVIKAAFSNFSRQLFRLYAMIKLKPERGKNKFQLYDGSERSFNDLLLLCRQSELKNNVELRKLCNEMVKELAEEQLCVNNDDAVDHLLDLAVVWRTNSLSVLNKAGTAAIGSALFIESSIFEHSCKPNAYLYLQGSKLEIRAITSIPKETKPSVNYLTGNNSKEKRAALLMERSGLICKCELCILEEKENLIDYDKLQNLIEDVEKKSVWKDYFDGHKEILPLLRKLYHEYDERITNRCFLAYQAATKLAAPEQITFYLTKFAKEHLKITYGTECTQYQTFENPNGITVSKLIGMILR